MKVSVDGQCRRSTLKHGWGVEIYHVGIFCFDCACLITIQGLPRVKERHFIILARVFDAAHVSAFARLRAGSIIRQERRLFPSAPGFAKGRVKSREKRGCPSIGLTFGGDEYATVKPVNDLSDVQQYCLYWITHIDGKWSRIF